MPLADHFDLADALAHPAFHERGRMAHARWLPADLMPPPGPPHDRPMLRIRGKSVRFRMSF